MYGRTRFVFSSSSLEAARCSGDDGGRRSDGLLQRMYVTTSAARIVIRLDPISNIFALKITRKFDLLCPHKRVIQWEKYR